MAPEFGKPIHQLPLIPADVLKKHRVHEPFDPRFRSAARLLQALWREDRALPIGSYVGEDGKRRNLGGRISEAAGRNGFVAFEIKYSESMREPMPELKPRSAELSDASGLFTDPAAVALRTNPLQQLWREHLLAQSMTRDRAENRPCLSQSPRRRRFRARIGKKHMV